MLDVATPQLSEVVETVNQMSDMNGYSTLILVATGFGIGLLLLRMIFSFFKHR